MADNNGRKYSNDVYESSMMLFGATPEETDFMLMYHITLDEARQMIKEITMVRDILVEVLEVNKKAS